MTDVREQLQQALGAAYAVERELGGGGMSRVFVAVDNALGRRVVIKVLTPELAQGLSADRFAREIKLAAALQEPHIVPVHSAGDAGGLPYFTMPYVEGESLRTRLLRGPIPLAEALGILRDVALALEYAHARGIVHRDIKPENVLLSGRTAVVADFGIAKALSAARTQGPGAQSGTLTSIGQSLGTPAYMAPEQAAGDPTDHRADLYAWGVMAYELMAGRHPFADKATTAQLMAAQVMEKPMPLVERKPGLPPPLTALVMQCLEKDPAARPQSAAEVLQGLDAIGSPGATSVVVGQTAATSRAPAVAAAPSAAAPSRPPMKHPVALAVALVAVALGVGVVFLVRKSPPAAGDRAPVATLASDTASHRVAVLPFVNRGDSADAYFAEGMTDAVRGTLTGLQGIEVIASASSGQYVNTTKTPRQIAEELGVRYLLTGTVRFAKGGDGPDRVQVSPALVEIASDGTARNRWEQPFDAEMKDVFKVQGEIAAKVASAMQGALGGATPAPVARAASADPQAYEAYLRGQAVWNDGANDAPATLRRALDYFEQAAARDSSMAEAWAAISRVSSTLYVNANPLAAYKQRALEAARRAMALDPRGTLGHRALGQYYLSVEREPERAAEEVGAALRISPRDVALLSLASSIKEQSGRLEEGLRDRAATLALDPLSAVRWNGYAMSLLRLRRYAEARTASLRAVALAPTSLNTNWTLMLADVGEGNVAAAQKVIARASKDASPSALAAEVATYFDLGWTLDAEHERLLLALGPEAFDDDRPLWALVRAQQYHTRGEKDATRAWGDSAVRYNAEMVRQSPDEAATRGALALSLAYAGRTSEAAAEAERTVALARQRKGAGSLNVPYFVHILARVYTLAGEKDKAVAALEEVVRLPFFVSRATLRVDPTFAPLKGHPAFERLVAGT